MNDCENIVVNEGRVLGSQLLDEAVGTSKDDNELNIAIRVIRGASVFILATEMYNNFLQLDIPSKTFLEELNKDLMDELKMLEGDEGGEMKYYKAGESAKR